MSEPPIGRLDSFARVSLATLPTAIEPMPNLSRALGGPALFVKRDDLTGLGLGGNKARQVEFWLGDARAKGADTVLITGAVQSNYVRTAAAGAARLGMACHVQLEERVPDTDHTYRVSGNVLLDRLFGATLHACDSGEDEAGADANLAALAARLRARGKRPYVIPLGPGHAPIGALGYVDAARELSRQWSTASGALEGAPDAIVIGSGSGHTHAGLLVGLRALGHAMPVLGACVRRGADLQRPRVAARAGEVAELLGVAAPSVADIEVSDRAFGPGYGRMDEPTVEAMTLAARCEGLVLDPTYTAKVMACLIAEVRHGRWPASARVLFVHTGGTPGLFAYEPAVTAALDSAARG